MKALNDAATNIPASIRDNPRIILFDGVCNLCSWTLAFVYRNDARSLYRFGWVQSGEGKEILRWCGLPDDRFDTMVTVESGIVYYKSTAFLRVARNLRFPWPILSVGLFLPLFIRDFAYDWLASRRYRFFGRKEECLLPDGLLRERFLGTPDS